MDLLFQKKEADKMNYRPGRLRLDRTEWDDWDSTATDYINNTRDGRGRSGDEYRDRHCFRPSTRSPDRMKCIRCFHYKRWNCEGEILREAGGAFCCNWCISACGHPQLAAQIRRALGLVLFNARIAVDSAEPLAGVPLAVESVDPVDPVGTMYEDPRWYYEW